MGEYTKAVFESKKYFTEDVMTQFEQIDNQRSRLEFVNKQVPWHVTNFLRIDDSDNSKHSLVVDEPNNNNEPKTFDKEPCSKPLMVPHSRFPTLSENVCVEYHKDRGRYLRANRKIKRGEIVAVESPVVAFPVIKECDDFCNCCFKPLERTSKESFTPLTCSTCKLVYWCSQDCQQKALATHHRYECVIRFPELLKQGHPGIGKLFMVFRIFTQKSLQYFRENYIEFMDFDPSTGSGLDDSFTSDYTTLFKLARHFPVEAPKLLEVSIVSIVFVRMLQSIGYFPSNGERDELDEDQLMVAELMSTLVPIINVNTHPIHDPTSEYQSKTVCAAVYPIIAAMFNHSCDPSLVRATWGDRLVLAAGRDIGKGEELTDMYTVHWTEYETEERKDYLERVFHFTCCCVACKEGWEPVEDDKQSLQNKEIQRRLAAHNLRGQTEYRLMYFIANQLK